VPGLESGQVCLNDDTKLSAIIEILPQKRFHLKL